MVSQFYQLELKLDKANSSVTEALNVHLTNLDGVVSSKLDDKRDDVVFVFFPFVR